MYIANVENFKPGDAYVKASMLAVENNGSVLKVTE